MTCCRSLLPLLLVAGCVAHSSPNQRHGSSSQATSVSVDRVLGQSRQGRPIELYRFEGDGLSGRPNQNVLIFAGIHGSEPTTVFAANELLKIVGRPSRIPFATTLYVIPVANPDGYAVKRRQNANGVDLNRNFPASNWKTTERGTTGPSPLSEPESKVLHDLVVELKPVRILSMHSIQDARKSGVNFDGPARAFADLMASHNGYRVLPTMGYPTPGSFGSWAGIDLNIPVITLEFPASDPGPKAWQQNREAILAFIRGR